MNNCTPHSFAYFLVSSIFLFNMGWCLDFQVCQAKTILKVESQKDFDGIKTILYERIVKGDKNIVVDFTKGRYYYKTQHIFFADKYFPDVSIKFKGNGATIISAGKDLRAGGGAVKYVKGAGFIDAEGNDFENYSRMFQSDSLVDILDENLKQCRIHCSELEGIGNIDCTNAFIRLTSWFTSFLYHVSKIEDSYVYFTADNLAPGYTQYGNYNVNYDYTVGKILPRFRLINLPLGGCEIVSTTQGLVSRSSEPVIHQCEAGFFIFFQNCELRHLSIEGFNVVGSRADSQIFRFSNLKAESIVVAKSTLSAARGIAIYVDGTDNVTVKSCEFHDNYQDVVNFTNTCANATVKNNTFNNNGKGVVNSFSVICRGGNYLISKNDIWDFNYGAIGVGVWHKAAEGSRPSYGVVERNHIYYTPSYIKDKASWTLVDGGAIYLWSKNDGAVISHNFIHDYEGMDSNRGIYCDDGTCYCSIYGNIVLNIGNCYSIDLRRSLMLDRLNIGLKSNIYNRIYGNAFNNRFRFQGRTGDSTSVKGGNTILVKEGRALPRIEEDNLVKESEDHVCDYNQRKWYRKGMRLVR